MSTIRVHTLKWHMIATIGVAIVVAGQFSGWNYGLAFGWENLVVALVLMLMFYAGFLQCLSEMGSTWPSAGGLAKYTSLAFGEVGGGLVSVAMAMTLVAATGIVGSFIAAYAETVLGIEGLTIRIVLFGVIMALHLLGTKEALWVVLMAGLIAVVTLLAFSGTAALNFDVANLKLGSLPLSITGVIQAIPFALWMYLGVEQAVTASEEAELPSRDVPRGLLLALVLLTLTACGVIIFAPGAGEVGHVSKAGDPLLAALEGVGAGQGLVVTLIGFGALLGLLASFFSLSYSASRQIYDLSRTGFFPAAFAKVTARGTPVPAFILVALVGFAISLVKPETVLLAVVLLFTSTYFLTTLAFLRLRKTMADVPRAYCAKGGVATGVITLLLSGIIFYACFSTDLATLGVITAVFVLVLLYRWMTARVVAA